MEDKEKIQNKEKFTGKKRWKYRKITKLITSALWDNLILFNMKTWNNWKPDIAQLTHNEDREIGFDKWKETVKLWPVDVTWRIENINIIDTRKKLYKVIEEDPSIEENDKIYLKDWIDSFIQNHFVLKRKKLEKKQNIPHKKFRKYYTLLAAKKDELTDKEKLIYRDICLTLANMLYDENHEFLDGNWVINQKGLEYIGRVFLKAIKNIPYSWSSKSYEKVFHDWDFNFLREESSEWEPTIWTLDHYVKAIMYLMDANEFNAYAEWWEEWKEERYKTKKAFLNKLYVAALLKEWIQGKKEVHKQLASIWKASKEVIKDDTNWNLSERFKSDASKMLKKWWRTDEIKDESWIRATYYWEDKDKGNDNIKETIISLLKEYFKRISKIEWINIDSIQSDKKWGFISSEDEDIILKELWEYLSELWYDDINISRRIKWTKKKSLLEGISSKYKEFTNKNPSPWLQQAYRIANWEVKRWSNGKYEDFKLIVNFLVNKEEYNEWVENEKNHIEDDFSLPQEISFYSNKNDLNMGNHHILDLEKNIFNRVKEMNDYQLWKSISLWRLRKYTERILKENSTEIDIYEDKISRWILPKPKNDDYKYITVGNQRISLSNLNPRTAKNTERFDELICLILNYFIKKNKIFYINKEDQTYYWLIKPEQLHNKTTFKERRFMTSDILRNSALNAKYENKSICFYTENEKSRVYPHFYSVNLGDLWDFIRLEKFIKN